MGEILQYALYALVMKNIITEKCVTHTSITRTGYHWVLELDSRYWYQIGSK